MKRRSRHFSWKSSSGEGGLCDDIQVDRERDTTSQVWAFTALTHSGALAPMPTIQLPGLPGEPPKPPHQRSLGGGATTEFRENSTLFFYGLLRPGADHNVDLSVGRLTRAGPLQCCLRGYFAGHHHWWLSECHQMQISVQGIND